jgi:hypothetical protein
LLSGAKPRGADDVPIHVGPLGPNLITTAVAVSAHLNPESGLPIEEPILGLLGVYAARLSRQSHGAMASQVKNSSIAGGFLRAIRTVEKNFGEDDPVRADFRRY